MNNLHYKHFQNYEKRNLEKLLGDKPFAKAIYGTGPNGKWQLVKYQLLIDISPLALSLNRERKTIKNELIRGAYFQLTKEVEKSTDLLCYSKDASDNYHRKVINDRKANNLKIIKFLQLTTWVKQQLQLKHSLKSIGGRSKIEFENGLIDASISAKTLYNYIANQSIDFINSKSLKREHKYHYRVKRYGKRQNGKSIDERPEIINNRSQFGHWEMDLVEGKKGTRKCLLTMSERLSRKGLALIIPSKEKQEIVKALRKLQMLNILIFNQNIKSISTDNGSEFWAWKKFSKSVVNHRDDIEVYFCHPYASYEKGGVENFNQQIRTIFPKGTDFTNISQYEVNEGCNQINNIYRGILQYKTANEVYNENIQN